RPGACSRRGAVRASSRGGEPELERSAPTMWRHPAPPLPAPQLMNPVPGAVTVDEPDSLDAGDTPTMPGREAAETFGVAGWTLVSRVTGLLRVAAIGATLGPTFFANIFQATNTVPNITYNLMAGSLLTARVVPSLVEALDLQSLDRARRIAQGLLGVVISGFCVAGIVVLALGPLIVHLLTLGIHDPKVAARARHESWVLLLLVVPQIVLYGVAFGAVAAPNARRHFALAAAA